MSALVDSARKYLDVKFRHRGRSPRALDCAGLPWLAYKDLGVDLPDFRLYGPEPHNDGLITHITAALGDPVAVAPVCESDLQAGDIAVIRFEVEPHHVCIITDYPMGGFAVLHADGHYGKVIEHRLSPDMVDRITHVFRRPV